MTDRIEKLAKEYATRRCAELDDGHAVQQLTASLDVILAEAFRAGAAAGAAEAQTSRSPQVEGEA